VRDARISKKQAGSSFTVLHVSLRENVLKSFRLHTNVREGGARGKEGTALKKGRLKGFC